MIDCEILEDTIWATPTFSVTCEKDKKCWNSVENPSSLLNTLFLSHVSHESDTCGGKPSLSHWKHITETVVGQWRRWAEAWSGQLSSPPCSHVATTPTTTILLRNERHNATWRSPCGQSRREGSLRAARRISQPPPSAMPHWLAAASLAHVCACAQLCLKHVNCANKTNAR